MIETNVNFALPGQTIALFTIATGIFDVYCLTMAAPGSTHYGYFIISYEFVYVGNRHGEFTLNQQQLHRSIIPHPQFATC